MGFGDRITEATEICIVKSVSHTSCTDPIIRHGTYQLEEAMKEILGFERTARENEAGWRGFIRRLVERGLDPGTLELVISD